MINCCMQGIDEPSMENRDGGSLPSPGGGFRDEPVEGMGQGLSRKWSHVGAQARGALDAGPVLAHTCLSGGLEQVALPFGAPDCSEGGA